MEILKAMAYAGFGFLAYKLSGVFIQNSIVQIIVSVVFIIIIFWVTEVVIRFFANRGKG